VAAKIYAIIEARAEFIITDRRRIQNEERVTIEVPRAPANKTGLSDRL
jgi:hypothetical protein